MSKLVLAMLNEKNDLEKFEEIDMSWVEQFNKDFQKQTTDSGVPFAKNIYDEELVDMTSYSILNSMVLTENDEEFRVNRSPLKATLRKLFGINDEQSETSLSQA